MFQKNSLRTARLCKHNIKQDFTKRCLSSNSLTLYHTMNARSLRCVWMLEELGVKDYKLVTMPFPPRVFYKKYLGINSLGTVPYLKDGDNVSLTESCGICQYLGVKYAQPSGPSLVVGPEEDDYPAYLNWMAAADATLTFPLAIALRYTHLQPGRADLAGQDYIQFFLGRLRRLDAYLLKEEQEGRSDIYLASGRFTAADICVSYALYFGSTLELPSANGSGKKITAGDSYSPQIRRYLERMMSRPGFAAAQQAQQKSSEEFEP